MTMITKLLRPVLNLLPDRIFLDLMFLKNFRRLPNWKHPRTFSEKLQWMKLYYRKPGLPMLVDKYEAKLFVAEIIGEKHIIPTFGMWNKPEEIDWNLLPNQFVLKTTNGGGNKSVVICRDKDSFNIANAINSLSQSMSRNVFAYGREWVYKDLKPRIIAEKYLSNQFSDDLVDYKIFCFNGTPRLIQVIQDRSSEETMDFYDFDWNIMDITFDTKSKKTYKHAKNGVPRPQCLDEMKKIASSLSANLIFVRVDLYEVDNVVYFGELTFSPNSGIHDLIPSKWNYILGDYLNLQ